jgi:hypothetical protein
MTGTIVTLLLLVVTVAPQERPPVGDVEPKRPIGNDWSQRNPYLSENNVIINEA